MAGIVFLRTRVLDEVRRFYIDTLGMTSWLEQPGIAILAHENMLIGLQQSDVADMDGLLTFWFRQRAEVDAAHARLAAVADDVPQVNERYRIYNFFARDPEGRRIECQAFLHATKAVAGVPALDPG